MTRPSPLFQLPDSLEEKILSRLPKEILFLTLVLSLPTVYLFGCTTALFFLAGGVLSTINFIWSKQGISRMLLFKKQKAVRSGLLLYGLRLLLIIGIFFIIIYFFSKKIIAFAAGFSTLIPVILVEAVLGLSRMKTWKN